MSDHPALLFEKLWVAAEPQTTLLNWSVHQMVFPVYEKVSRHLVGDTIGGSARITSEIKHFDPKNVTSHYPRARYFSVTYKGKKVLNFIIKPFEIIISIT